MPECLLQPCGESPNFWFHNCRGDGVCGVCANEDCIPSSSPKNLSESANADLKLPCRNEQGQLGVCSNSGCQV